MTDCSASLNQLSYHDYPIDIEVIKIAINCNKACITNSPNCVCAKYCSALIISSCMICNNVLLKEFGWLFSARCPHVWETLKSTPAHRCLQILGTTPGMHATWHTVNSGLFHMLHDQRFACVGDYKLL